jgi:hypothetical protein
MVQCWGNFHFCNICFDCKAARSTVSLILLRWKTAHLSVYVLHMHKYKDTPVIHSGLHRMLLRKETAHLSIYISHEHKTRRHTYSPCLHFPLAQNTQAHLQQILRPIRCCCNRRLQHTTDDDLHRSALVVVLAPEGIRKSCKLFKRSRGHSQVSKPVFLKDCLSSSKHRTACGQPAKLPPGAASMMFGSK